MAVPASLRAEVARQARWPGCHCMSGCPLDGRMLWTKLHPMVIGDTSCRAYLHNWRIILLWSFLSQMAWFLLYESTMMWADRGWRSGSRFATALHA